MHDYETEEQQIEALKKWWKENSTSLILGLSLGAFGLGGWVFYNDTKQAHRVEASDLYMSVMRQVELGNIDISTKEQADKLVAEYADTPYASLSSLALATLDYEKGEIESAISHLKWANGHATEEEVKHIARLRIAKILLSQEKYDEAEVWLMSEHPPSFISRYEEVKGDLHVSRGQIEQARVAYDKAIKQSVSSNRWLKLKREDLGPSKFEAQADIEPPA